MARTAEPYDVSSWDDLGAMDGVPKGTYPHPFAHGVVYVFYRAAPG
ncbi:hypothetical protein [Halosolutus gelatinilyticus]|nr:hypothetical protein [Halosolutus gelatinilyticus]